MDCTTISPYLFPVLLLAMAVYVLVAAISGKGRLFQMDNIIEEAKPKYHKYTRALYFCLAAIMILLALVSFLQSALYNQLASYRATDRYKTDFADVIDEKGEVTFTKDGTTYGPYSVNKEYNESLPIQVFLAKAQEAHPEVKWTQATSSPLSCSGSAATSTENPIELLYYDETVMFGPDGTPEYPLRENDALVYNDENKLVYRDVELHPVYVSSFSKTRSDADDGSFVTKLYGCGETLWTVLNYVFLGLAVVSVVALFVITRKFTDKEKLAKSRTQAAGQSMPSSAFDFEEEKTEQKE